MAQIQKCRYVTINGNVLTADCCSVDSMLPFLVAY